MSWLAGLILFSSAVSAKPFIPGEVLKYDVSWFFITAGEASLEVGQPFVSNNIEQINFTATAKSQLVFFFKVNDRIESVCIAEDLLPIRFEKHLREGKYKKDLAVLFNRNDNTAKYEELVVPVGADCRDVLGSFYYFRTMPLPEIGKEIKVCSHTDKKDYPLAIEALKKEQIEVDAGKFNTVKVVLKPAPGFEGLFQNKGNIWIWLTDDERRIPVKIKASVPILGSVNIELKSIN